MIAESRKQVLYHAGSHGAVMGSGLIEGSSFFFPPCTLQVDPCVYAL